MNSWLLFLAEEKARGASHQYAKSLVSYFTVWQNVPSDFNLSSYSGPFAIWVPWNRKLGLSFYK